jgi:hypothetical protein
MKWWALIWPVKNINQPATLGVMRSDAMMGLAQTADQVE